ncbi:MAG TPA: hypothetical protein VFY94_13785 [Rhodanobacteraceae bacterium]|jgi:hypothetical protein|nr:hypothetical protein [Rhodanobacteraceae bacterium]
MPSIDAIAPLAGLPDAPRPPAHQDGKPPQPITGKVFALKDGSGYAALASDGNYYRVDAGNGLTFSRAGGFVDAAMVDVAHGPVKSVKTEPDRDLVTATAEPTGAADADGSDDGVDVQLSGNAPRGLPAPHPALHDAGHALASSHETRALMVRKPGAAVDSQANLSPQSVLSLLG